MLPGVYNKCNYHLMKLRLEQKVQFYAETLQKLMDSRTLLSRLMGSAESIEPMLTRPLDRLIGCSSYINIT